MVIAEIIIAVILAILAVGLYFTRQDTHETNIHLLKITKQLDEILKLKKYE